MKTASKKKLTADNLTDIETRKFCLLQAISVTVSFGDSGEDIVSKAEKFYKFTTKKGN